MLLYEFNEYILGLNDRDREVIKMAIYEIQSDLDDSYHELSINEILEMAWDITRTGGIDND